MAKRTKTEDPKRLRECLNALGEACGHDVFRFEMASTPKGWRFIVTCSNQAKEEDVAALIAAKLTEIVGEVKLDLSTVEKTGGADV